MIVLWVCLALIFAGGGLIAFSYGRGPYRTRRNAVLYGCGLWAGAALIALLAA